MTRTEPDETDASPAAPITFPGAVAPDRRRRVDAAGVGIATYEWGPEEGPPLFLAHGGFDFARTFDVSRPSWPPPVGGWWPGTSGATATAITQPSTPGMSDIRDPVAVMTTTGRAVPVSATPRAAP